MARIYVTRRGHVGASSGLFGALVIGMFWMMWFTIVATVMLPVMAALLVSGMAWAGDEALRAIPGYRRHRSANALKWPRETAKWSSDALSKAFSTRHRP